MYISDYEVITEGSCIDRRKYFEKKSNWIYVKADRDGKYRRCIIIDDLLIKNDSGWYKEKKLKGKPIDMEVACAYLKVLEERLYNTLVEVEQWSVYISHICRVRQKTEHPELEPEEGESQEAKWEKSRLRVNCRNGYNKKIMDDIVKRIQMKGVDAQFMKRENLYSFLLDNLLYNVRKELWAYGIQNELKAVNKIIKSYAKLWQAEEELKVIKSKINHANIKKMAREKAYKMLFLSRDWNMETWIEIIFLKFYKEAKRNRPPVEIKKGFTKKGEEKYSADIEELKTRKIWLISEGQKWFKEIGNNYTWQLTEEAVDALVEVEEEEKRLDLMNYVITVDKSKFSKINWMIRKGYDKKEALEIEAGLHSGQFTRKLEEEKKIEFYPFLICLYWKKSNISFSEFFKLSLLETTIQDNKIKEAYYSQAFGYNDILDPKKKGLEKDFSMDFNRLMYHIDMIARYGNKYEQTNHFWYTPMMNKTPDCICMNAVSIMKAFAGSEFSEDIENILEEKDIPFEINGEFLANDKEFATPPWTSLRKLEQATVAFENNDSGLDEKWLKLMNRIERRGIYIDKTSIRDFE
ncbi:MAG: hypothetical protein II992_09500 [Lachnospiraceae bacterium]|nr:hypothetical protein [Lachnospiraceae bacterium]